MKSQTTIFHPLLLLGVSLLALTACGEPDFTDREKRILASLSLAELPRPVSESNQYAFNPEAQTLGAALFNEKGLSANRQFSCASCHHADKYFTDGLPTGIAAGKTDRNTPALHGVAWQTWFYWDGRRDSLWSQALTPIEAAKEMAGTRTEATRLIASTPAYRQQYQAIFGPLPFNANDPALSQAATPIGTKEQKNRWFKLAARTQTNINTVYANIGKAMAAYQHTLKPQPTRFDEFQQQVADGLSITKITALNKLELQGAKLFLNEKRTQCLECHNGPLLTNGFFHNLGTGNVTGPVFDFGRELGMQAVLFDEFNCQGKYSDAKPVACEHLVYLNRESVHMRGAYKTPTLRNIPATGPYFHDGRFNTLEQVVRFYANPPAMSRPDEHELRPGFELNEEEIKALTAFLQSFEATE